MRELGRRRVEHGGNMQSFMRYIRGASRIPMVTVLGISTGSLRTLDYLQKLGVDAIWLAPIYPSPQVDFGYDIADYTNVDSQYGTLADFDRLRTEAQRRHIRIILDMILNHTSDQSAWFKESASSRTNSKANWYV